MGKSQIWVIFVIFFEEKKPLWCLLNWQYNLAEDKYEKTNQLSLSPSLLWYLMHSWFFLFTIVISTKTMICFDFWCFCYSGLSINDVIASGGRGYQGFCDHSTKALVLKSVMMGRGGVKNYQKLHDVIYERPLLQNTLSPSCNLMFQRTFNEWLFSGASVRSSG